MHLDNVSEREPSSARQETWFLRSAAALLLLTALAKGFSAFGSNSILEKPDPVFWVLKNRELLILVAAVELAVAALLVSGMPLKIRRGGLLWLCANFLLYRAGLWVTGSPPACKCLGELAGRIGLSDAQASWVMLGILGYLLGGCLFFVRRSRCHRILEDFSDHHRGGPGIRAH
ncbi:MAG: hypothetical protein RIT19_2663 [Verrucomicrobiota bacterium]|jgi:hypothetical protein